MDSPIVVTIQTLHAELSNLRRFVHQSFAPTDSDTAEAIDLCGRIVSIAAEISTAYRASDFPTPEIKTWMAFALRRFYNYYGHASARYKLKE